MPRKKGTKKRTTPDAAASGTLPRRTVRVVAKPKGEYHGTIKRVTHSPDKE